MIRLLLFVMLLVSGCKRVLPDGRYHPADDPFEAGRICGRGGLTKDHNPFPATSDFSQRRAEWANGHTVGMADKAIEERDHKLLTRTVLP